MESFVEGSGQEIGYIRSFPDSFKGVGVRGETVRDRTRNVRFRPCLAGSRRQGSGLPSKRSRVNTNPDHEFESWESRLVRMMPLFGHRNWIVAADAAYPAQSNPGIETLTTGCDHAELLDSVLAAIAASSHVRAHIYLDSELQLVTEEDVLGGTPSMGR